MEINQATQTFLLFFFIFITSLLGFAIYIKKHEKLSKISLANAVQTSILIVGIFTLLVFGGSYYFVLSDVKASEQPLKDALSITASFFGGFATLIAAYIASLLFNDWKDEKNYELESKYLENTLLNIAPIFSELMLIRNDSNNLKKIDSIAILKTNYLNSTRFDMFDYVIKVYPDLKIYCDLTKDNTLINLYNVFDKKCFILDSFKSDLFYKKYNNFYRTYLKNVAPQIYKSNQELNSSNEYRNEVNDEIKKAIDDIKFFFESKSLEAKIEDKIEKVSYDEWIESTFTLLNQIQDYCTKQLRPKSN